MILELPFSNDPAQVFTTQLGEAKYTIEAKYNDRSGVWTLDLYDAATQALVVASLPLVIRHSAACVSAIRSEDKGASARTRCCCRLTRGSVIALSSSMLPSALSTPKFG